LLLLFIGIPATGIGRGRDTNKEKLTDKIHLKNYAPTTNLSSAVFCLPPPPIVLFPQDRLTRGVQISIVCFFTAASAVRRCFSV
jgi:hypothetical protein